MKKIGLIVLIIVVYFTTISCGKKICSFFLIGDSISIQYYPYLKEYVGNDIIIDRKKDDGKAFTNLDVPMGSNGGDSRMVLQYLRFRCEESVFTPDYMLINCGLHDVKRNSETNEIQISEQEYRSNLTEIFKLLRSKNIKPIWIKTTWVNDSIHNIKPMAFKRYNKDVIRYNQIADSVCFIEKIAEIDLYTFSVNQGIDKFADHVHYVSESQKEQAIFIGQFIKTIIN